MDGLEDGLRLGDSDADIASVCTTTTISLPKPSEPVVLVMSPTSASTVINSPENVAPEGDHTTTLLTPPPMSAESDAKSPPRVRVKLPVVAISN